MNGAWRLKAGACWRYTNKFNRFKALFAWARLPIIYFIVALTLRRIN